MTYWALNSVFLGIVAAVVLAGVVMKRTPRWGAVSLAAALLLAATAVFDNLMIAAGLVAYDPLRIQGWFIGVAPVEDFAYTVAAVVGLPALWVLLGPTKKRAGRA